MLKNSLHHTPCTKLLLITGVKTVGNRVQTPTQHSKAPSAAESPRVVRKFSDYSRIFIRRKMFLRINDKLIPVFSIQEVRISELGWPAEGPPVYFVDIISEKMTHTTGVYTTRKEADKELSKIQKRLNKIKMIA